MQATGQEFDPSVWLFKRGSLGGGMTVLPFAQTEVVLEAFPEALHAGMVKVSARTVKVMLEMVRCLDGLKMKANSALRTLDTRMCQWHS